VELVYFDWGKARASGTDAGTTFSGDVSAQGFGLGVAYFMPFSPEWSGVARLGATQTDAKFSVAGSGSWTNKDPYAYYGLGVAYHFDKNLALTGEADFSRAKYGAKGLYETANVRLLSIGLRFLF
jgi:hypothetical protein